MMSGFEVQFPEYSKSSSMVFQFLLKVETNYKLNLIDLNGNNLIKDFEKVEIHYP